MGDSLTVGQFAARFGTHPDTIRRAIDRGELPAVRIGRAVRIPSSVAEELSGGPSLAEQVGVEVEKALAPVSLRLDHLAQLLNELRFEVCND